jgi:hypothetical protein
MDLYRAIKNRVSTRKYSEKQLESNTLNQVKRKLQNLRPLNPNIKVRLELIEDTKITKTVGLGSLGGKLKINAPQCIVGITEKKEGCIENIGFLLEQVVLELQNDGISTIWLGTYNRDNVKLICNVKEEEQIVIVIALGYEEKSFFNNGIRKLMNTSKRKDITETCFYQEWKYDISTYLLKEPSLKRILNMSSRYPSAGNVQPVSVIMEENMAVFFIKENKKSEYYKIDAGIFMAHFYLSCMEEGYKPTICIDQAPDKNYNISNDIIFIGIVKYN